jgi:hypothetical protein
MAAANLPRGAALARNLRFGRCIAASDICTQVIMQRHRNRGPTAAMPDKRVRAKRT